MSLEIIQAPGVGPEASLPLEKEFGEALISLAETAYKEAGFEQFDNAAYEAVPVWGGDFDFGVSLYRYVELADGNRLQQRVPLALCTSETGAWIALQQVEDELLYYNLPEEADQELQYLRLFAYFRNSRNN